MSVKINDLIQATKIIIHSPCPDGNMSHYLIRKVNKEAEFIPYTHGTTVLNIDDFKDGHLLFIDLIPQTLIDFCKVAKTVLVIDHHKPSYDAAVSYMNKEKFPDNLFMSFYNEICASMILFNILSKHNNDVEFKLIEDEKTHYLLPNYITYPLSLKEKYVIDIVNECDLGREYTLTYNQKCFGMALIQDLSIKHLKSLLEYSICDIIQIGEPLYIAKMKEVYELKNKLEDCTIVYYEDQKENVIKQTDIKHNNIVLEKGKLVLYSPSAEILLNNLKEVKYKCKKIKLKDEQWKLVNNILDEVENQNFDVLMVYYHKIENDNKKTTVSLRTHRKKDIDCSKIAKSRGGGGHKGAAQFVIKGVHVTEF